MYVSFSGHRARKGLKYQDTEKSAIFVQSLFMFSNDIQEAVIYSTRQYS
jgi:hypothetical protein